jgi:hypothetical protein
MRVGRKSGTGPIGLGFRALKGGGVVVGVVVDEGDPRVVLSTFLPTAADGDRLTALSSMASTHRKMRCTSSITVAVRLFPHQRRSPEVQTLGNPMRNQSTGKDLVFLRNR